MTGWTSAPVMILLCILMVVIPLSASSEDISRPNNWSRLVCYGVKQASLGDLSGGLGASNDKSKDELLIVRSRHTLQIQMNQIDVATHLGAKFVATDIFTITHEGKDGIAAFHSDQANPVVHSIAIDKTGTSVIWTETALSFLGKNQPLSTSILLACNR